MGHVFVVRDKMSRKGICNDNLFFCKLLLRAPPSRGSAIVYVPFSVNCFQYQASDKSDRQKRPSIETNRTGGATC